MKLARSKVYFTKANVIKFGPFPYLQNNKILMAEENTYGLA